MPVSWHPYKICSDPILWPNSTVVQLQKYEISVFLEWISFGFSRVKIQQHLFLATSIFKGSAVAPHSSTLAWKIPWTEEPGRLWSMGSRRVGHDWATSLSLFTFMHWRRQWQPTPVFLPGESQGRGSLVGCRLGVARSRPRLSDSAAAAQSYECHG